MTTLLTREQDTAFVDDGFDPVPSQPTGADHAIGRLWQQTLNGSWAVPDRHPDHPIAQLWQQTLNGSWPLLDRHPDHPIARLFRRAMTVTNANRVMPL